MGLLWRRGFRIGCARRPALRASRPDARQA
jgi:hypothetical protein